MRDDCMMVNIFIEFGVSFRQVICLAWTITNDVSYQIEHKLMMAYTLLIG